MSHQTSPGAEAPSSTGRETPGERTTPSEDGERMSKRVHIPCDAEASHGVQPGRTRTGGQDGEPCMTTAPGEPATMSSVEELSRPKPRNRPAPRSRPPRATGARASPIAGDLPGASTQPKLRSHRGVRPKSNGHPFALPKWREQPRTRRVRVHRRKRAVADETTGPKPECYATPKLAGSDPNPTHTVATRRQSQRHTNPGKARSGRFGSDPS